MQGSFICVRLHDRKVFETVSLCGREDEELQTFAELLQSLEMMEIRVSISDDRHFLQDAIFSHNKNGVSSITISTSHIFQHLPTDSTANFSATPADLCFELAHFLFDLRKVVAPLTFLTDSCSDVSLLCPFVLFVSF